MKKLLSFLLAIGLLITAGAFATKANSQDGNCPHCSNPLAANAWQSWSFTDGEITSGHYYLKRGYASQTGTIYIPAGADVCLDLNGNEYYTQKLRPFDISGNLTIMDSKTGGQFVTTGANNTNGGFAVVRNTGTLNILSGTILRIDQNDIAISRGGLVYIDDGAVSISGGELAGGVTEVIGTTSSQGGNIYMKGGSLDIFGGVISGGMALSDGIANANGGNIFAGADAVVTISGGTVKDGYSDLDGGNIYLSGKSLTLTSGNITGGHALRQGGNISQANETAEICTSLLGGTVSGGVAGGKLNTDNTKRGSGGGGNFYSYSANGSLTVSNCTISGDMKFDAIASVTLSGKTKIGLGKSNGLFVPAAVDLDVTGLTDGSEIFIHASDVFTTTIPASDATRIAGYFKGAVRTTINLDTDTNTLVGAQGNTGYCPHCYDPAKPATVTWYDVGFAPNANKLHCYMKSSDVATGNRTVSQDIVLDLNGYTFYRENGRIIMYAADKTITVMDTFGGGKIKGEGSDTAQNANGAVFQFPYKSNVVLYSGTLTMEPKTGTSVVPKGGIINAVKSGSTFTMYGGLVRGGSVVGEGGGNIHMNAGTTFTLNAGIIKDGAASGKSGGNIYCAGKAEIKGGYIIGGTASDGGNLYLTGTCEMSGGYIVNGTATVKGGNIFTYATTSDVDISGGTVKQGSAANAGNIYFEGGLSLSNGDLIGGEGELGGNLFVGGGTFDMTGGTVLGGSATTKGGNLYSSATSSKLYLSGGRITLGSAVDGGNIHLNNGLLEVSSNMLIINGRSTSTGGNLRIGASATAGSATANLSGGCIVAGFSESGGNIYSVQKTNISGTAIMDGQAANGGNVYIGGGITTLSSGNVSGGFATDKGGNFYQSNAGAKLNISGGEVSNGFAETSGGNIHINNGEMDMTGGTVADGLAGTGGNIYLAFFNNGTASINGANTPTITGGKAFYGPGGNIALADEAHRADDDEYIPHSTKPWLEIGNCTITNGSACSIGQNIYINDNAWFRVLENFASTTSVHYFASQLPDTDPYGKFINTTCNTAAGDYPGTLLLENYMDQPYIFHNDGKLQVASAALIKDGNYTWYKDNASLVSHYGDSDYMRPDAGDLVLAGGTYTIDLVGQNVNITGNGLVFGADSANDSYKQHGKATFGNEITLAGIKTQLGGKTYFALNEGNTYSFHRGGLDITSVSLRPSNAGLYYSALWQCDEMLAKKIQNYGVAVSLDSAPGDDFIEQGKSLYTQQKNFVSGTTGNGVLVTGILDVNRSDLNSSYACKPIYAAAYITLDGKNYTGIAESHSLHSMLKLLSDNIYDYCNYADTLNSFIDKWDDYGLVGESWDLNFNVPDAIEMLSNLYSATSAYHGELHDHADTGGNSDGRYTLSQWLQGIKMLDMDFATILDHRQDRHMHLDDWDETYFIGGSEIGAGLTDLKDATRSWLHMNMIFADWQDFRKAVEEFDAIAPDGGFRHYEGEDGAWYMTNLQYFSDTGDDCKITKAQMAELIRIIRDNNGMFVHPHPKMSDCVVSDNIEDYWYADWTGLEVLYTYRGYAESIKENYKLWTQLLASGKKIWATAGNDEHNAPSNKAITTIYATQKHADAFMEQVSVGNFTAGPIGIQMAIGNTVMGSECDFGGQELVFRVSDFHSSITDEISNYRVVLIADEEIVQQWNITAEEELYHYQDTDPSVKYYRVEIYNAEDNTLLALGNPIWNTAV